MNLEQLRALGAFVDPSPVQRDVEWTHELDTGEVVTEKFQIHVRRQSFGSVERMLSARGDRSRSAEVISASILFGVDGSEQLTYEQAYELHPGLAYVLLDAINEVNTVKKSAPPRPSGTS